MTEIEDVLVSGTFGKVTALEFLQFIEFHKKTGRAAEREAHATPARAAGGADATHRPRAPRGGRAHHVSAVPGRERLSGGRSAGGDVPSLSRDVRPRRRLEEAALTTTIAPSARSERTAPTRTLAGAR